MLAGVAMENIQGRIVQEGQGNTRAISEVCAISAMLILTISLKTCAERHRTSTNAEVAMLGGLVIYVRSLGLGNYPEHMDYMSAHCSKTFI